MVMETGALKVGGAYVYTGAHMSQWLDAIGQGVTKYVDNFEKWSVTPWTATAISVGAGTSAAAAGTVQGGSILITNAANENDGLELQIKGEAFKLETSKPCYFGARVKISHATQSDLLVGLCITDTTLIATHAVDFTDGLGFLKLDGSTDLSAFTRKNGASTANVIATADTSAHTMELLWDGTSKVRVFYDGTEQTALSGANLIDDEELTPSIAFKNGDANVRTCEVSWVRAIQIG